MCGIAGSWGAPGDASAMARLLQHRGPDGRGILRIGAAQLAARRLAIFDPDAGDQPMTNDDRSLAIVFNGALFNHVELRQTLEKSGVRFRTRCDTEVVLRSFEHWGARCLEHFNGMFAIAIASEDQLFLARDRMGEKPLYYTDGRGPFRFASEIKAFQEELDLRPAIDTSFWALEAPLAPDTLFDGIRELPPAHWLQFDGTTTTIERYWSLPAPERPEDVDDAEWVSRLRDLLDDAVRIRLRGDAPVGIYLSGGLDSALIGAFAGVDLAYTSRAASPELDESSYARIVSAALGTQLVEVTPTAADLKKRLGDLVYALDHPVATASPLAEFMLAERAAQDVKVVLNGQGADELFGGYTRYLLMTEERRLAESPALREYVPLARFFWGAEALGPSADRFIALTRRAERGSEALERRIRDCFARHRELVSQMGAADLETTFPSLIQMNDRSAGAYGLENRTPFLDHRVVDLAFRISDRAKIRGLESKWILRQVARGLVPDAVIQRADKRGLVVPVQQWLRHELRDWRTALLAKLAVRGMQAPPLQNRGDFDRRDYQAICLELWFQRFFPGYGR